MIEPMQSLNALNRWKQVGIGLALCTLSLVVTPSSMAVDESQVAPTLSVWNVNGSQTYRSIAVIDREDVVSGWEKPKKIASELKTREAEIQKLVESANTSYEDRKRSGASSAELSQLQTQLQSEINNTVKSVQDFATSNEKELENEINDAVIAEAKLRGVDLVVSKQAIMTIVADADPINLSESVKNRLNGRQVAGDTSRVPSASAPLRFAVTDLDVVISSFPRANALRASLAAQEKELMQFVDAGNARYEERKQAGASEAELAGLHASIQSDINKKAGQIKSSAAQLEKQLEAEIDQAVAAEAKLQSVNIVIDKKTAAKVMPGAESTDLTEGVIKRLSEIATGGAPAGKRATPGLGADIEVLTGQIQQNSQNPDLYLSRSLYYLASGSSISSHQDAKKVLDTVSEKSSNSKDEYRLQMSIILMCLNFEKNKDKESETVLLNQAKSRCKKNQWPFPLIQYLSGELNEASIVPPTTEAQIEKHIIVGFRKLIQGKNTDAIANFRAAKNLPSKSQPGGSANYKKIAASMLAMLSG